jgi:hypothetical protein
MTEDYSREPCRGKFSGFLTPPEEAWLIDYKDFNRWVEYSIDLLSPGASPYNLHKKKTHAYEYS